MSGRKRRVARARGRAGVLSRVGEGVVVGLVVAACLLARDWVVDYCDRQAEIAYIRDVIVSGRLAVSSAQAGTVAVLLPDRRVRSEFRSREAAQEEQWRRFVAELSDVLAHRTSRLTFEETRELRRRFPGLVVDGQRLLGDPLDIIIRADVPAHYRDMFVQAESVRWLGLPPASQALREGLIPASRQEAGE